MRLKQIKLAGFKSFVDATKIPFLNALSAIIGPNGCGKSNVIDAVRWVLGESSAKHLRGDSMMDVIFNGSSARRPVSVASVELLFENNHGRLGGEYASYNEISVKRQVSRDGDSAYFLNGQKCRRKDITELFMGTGLGARSYAIIGQGTISRLIESKPQELRVFIEEAAGISRYKERRRDTENRIRHTRENLERLGDIRSELTAQLEKLAAQAKAAKKYRELKQSERRCHSELLVIRYQALMAQFDSLSKQISVQELQLAKLNQALEKESTELTQLRTQLDALSDTEHNERAIYYEANTQIASLEQQLQAAQLRQTQTREALTDLITKLDAINESLFDNQSSGVKLAQNVQSLEQKITELQVNVEQKKLQLEQIQTSDRALRLEKEQQVRSTTEYRHSVSLLQKQFEHIEGTEKRLNSQYLADETTLQSLLSRDAASTEKTQAGEQDIEGSLADLSSRLQELDVEAEIQVERQFVLDDELEQSKSSLSQASLTLQNSQQQRAGIVARAEVLDQLLSASSGDSDRLWQHLNLVKGWEQAAQLALGATIHFPLTRDGDAENQGIGFIASTGQDVGANPDSVLDTQSEQTLPEDEQTPVSSKLNISPWLKGVHWVSDITSAEALLPNIALDERIATADGYLLGHGFKLTQLAEEPTLVAFNEERQELNLVLQNLEHQIAQQETDKRQIEEKSNQISMALVASRQELERIKLTQTKIKQAITTKQHQDALKQQQINDLTLRVKSANDELSQIRLSQCDVLKQRNDQQNLLDSAIELESDLTEKVRQSAQALGVSRRDYEQSSQSLEVLKSQLAPLTTKIALNQQAHTQLEIQAKDYAQQKIQLEAESNTQKDPSFPELGQFNRLRQALDKQLELRQTKQLKLEEIRVQQVKLQEQVDTLGANKKQQLAKIDTLTQTNSESKLLREGVKGQADSQRLVLQEEGITLEDLKNQALGDKTQDERQAELDRIRRSIGRLGAINLAAIEEYDQQSERKQYLDEQDDDLNKALHSLEDAIRKIDRETRSRFKQTFEQVNYDLGLLFPKVFGGGSAYLAMTDDDLLDTGVTIMARPPGKKNSTIHLLSGGEKALTALSLVFAIFRLNPAPFCMLDEVDAPLDDANVERFCRLLQEMSQSVQFIYISHNKITMEMADQLIGVTMHEPGVSRIVAVDIDEAVALADAG